MKAWTRTQEVTMAGLPHQGVVVGVDGYPSSQAALEWAAEEALRFNTGLHLLHATDIDWLVAASLISRADDHPVTDAILDAAVDQLQRRFPDLRVSAQATTGTAAQDLTCASVHAREIVLGSHGRAQSRLPLGSVAHAVAMHAACPVVVVRESGNPEARTGPVVVGVDGSELSLSAVDFALEQAARRGTSMIAIHAWWVEFVDGVVVTTPGSAQWQKAAERMRLDVAETLAGCRERYPDVDVSVRLEQARPADALVEASEYASLVVVGARGHGGFAGLLLGSVSRELLMHAAGPVAVARSAPPIRGSRTHAEDSEP
jgi:nucleotide-binding universal stress UspA family protein